ncbi:hypothetical protein AGDE_02355 [Angomonas deanei]|nr:hypothetical protein AGDE_02355 [Angomonas deanei]|eukprot:EPY41569.1 hypothetical protein AGDE_02355 [Angomonas deanei]
MDLRTSVRVVSRGDWFFKWAASGRAVHPRFIWVDTKSYLLVWSSKETHDPTFSGSVRLESICQVTPREVVQSDGDGLPLVYHVLLIETTQRILQLATERREKADVWYEALNIL